MKLQKVSQIFIFIVLNLILITSGYPIRNFDFPGIEDYIITKDQEGLVGPVQSVKRDLVKFANQSGQWVEKSRYSLGTLEYDQKGNLIMETSQHPDGSMYIVTKYTFDSDGRLTNKSTGINMKFTYDAAGRLKEVLSEGSKITFAYDEQGRVFEEVRSQLDGPHQHTSKIAYRYDSKGHIIEEKNYSSDSGLFDKTTYKYDNDGNMIEKVSYLGDNVIHNKWTYKYDNKKNKAEEISYRPDGSVSQKHQMSYDDRNNRTGIIFFNPNGTIESKQIDTYEYDSRGNWIRREEKLNWAKKPENDSLEVTYRTITYYPAKN